MRYWVNAACRIGVLVVVSLGMFGCQMAEDPVPEQGFIQFTDVTDEAGLGMFRHDNGEDGKKYYAEQMGSGAGFIDYDGDGWLDILLAGGGYWDRAPHPWYKPLWMYRNMGDGTFTEVTDQVGLKELDAFTLGVATADYDNDGDQDILITNLNENMLLENKGGVFERRGVDAGLSSDDEWSSSTLWIDGNRDGWLDVYVGNYADWTPETDKFCPEGGVEKLYCIPADYEGQASRYYEARGDGSFVDRTREAGVYHSLGKALGMAEWDFDQDGWSDFVVANDGEGDLLFLNNRDGTFSERGVQSGIAFSEHGEARAGMGIDIGVVDQTGHPSVFVGNFSTEMIGVYRYLGNGLFSDRAARSQIGQPSLNTLTFGLMLVDVDLDTDLDLFVANGHVYPDRLVGQDKITYEQRAQLFENDGGGLFEEVPASTTPPLELEMVARGAAYGDYDRDGDLDFLIVENNGPAHLWRSDVSHRNWLRVTVTGTNGNRDAFGTHIWVHAGGQVQERRIRSGGSYLSQNEIVAAFGMLDIEVVDSMLVSWPDGQIQTLYDLPVNIEAHIIQGQEGWSTRPMPGRVN
ncbi:MAG: CRTAC1 family protein [Rhodothermaceae bacterium]|nr:CRTAC1 family protein [Rhodothermaceae bacterium]MXZ57526.1 CRTAC1 family protein [Rhodothermaceae bacterium]MYB90510.1 CRTAC1 family protein [Rhodothermaceae bacterium]MYD68183.1 CRTAC1 family protein [Rhodothermaceae bacterium]MYG44174.1 CRTAC1 family protein [Rhodothermaceae bacterium]